MLRVTVTVMSQFTQWFQRQLDMPAQLPQSGRNAADLEPSEHDGQPELSFWERYENVQNDQRDAKINDKFSLMGRALSATFAVGGVRDCRRPTSTPT